MTEHSITERDAAAGPGEAGPAAEAAPTGTSSPTGPAGTVPQAESADMSSPTGPADPAPPAALPAEAPAEPPASPPLAAPVERAASTGFRPDLEGLRGVAILMVLAFHAGLPGMAGGFVGVDVFFVLSGFLITGLLLREHEQHGRVDLRAFYARRARRILPAAAVVIVATLAAAAVVLAPLDLVGAAADAVAAALSVGNIRFAAQEMDYFAAAGAPSPFLHYWSLGVEEQFYLVWPALLILAARAGRPRLGPGLVLVAVLTTVLAASYVAAFYLTEASQAWAFYSLPTRAWQLALGGLLAAVSLAERLPRVVLVPVSWLGLGAVLASAVVIDPGTAYPGAAALLPCLGAAAVILGSGSPFGAGLLLSRAPMRFLGRISYSLYLVHWPILVLPAAGLTIGQELPLGARAGLALVSVAIGYACYRLVESPIHRGRLSATRPGRTLALAGATIVATALIGGAVIVTTNSTIDAYTSVVATADGDDVGPEGSGALETVASTDAVATQPSAGPASPTPAGSAGPQPGAGGLASPGSAAPGSPGASPSIGGPAISPAAVPSGSASPTAGPGSGGQGSSAPTTAPSLMSTATPAPTARPLPTTPPRPRGAQPLPPSVRPKLAQARDDTELLVRNGCNLQHNRVQPPDCTFGDPASGTTVALVGDSHTAHWFPTVERIATERGWRLVTFTKYDCRFMEIRMYSAILKREYTECPAWREIVIERLQALQPQLVIVGVSRFPAVINPEDNDPVRQGELLARVLARVPGRIAILVDTPRFPFDVPGCISGHTADVRACEVSRARAFLSRHRIVEETAAKISGAAVLDMSGWICPWDTCPVVLNGMIVHRDNNHLTATFAASLADAFAAELPDIDAPVR